MKKALYIVTGIVVLLLFIGIFGVIGGIFFFIASLTVMAPKAYNWLMSGEMSDKQRRIAESTLWRVLPTAERKKQIEKSLRDAR